MTLTSDGDMPLDITAVSESTAVARSHMVSDNCVAVLAPGATWSMSILYNPLLLASPSGLAYETLTVTVTSNSLQTTPFIPTFTIRVRVGNSD